MTSGTTPIPPGTLIGKVYRIVRALGSGAMGVVCLARDERLDREVAIKFLHPEKLQNPRVLALFHNEAKAMARVRHPNVVTLYTVGVWEGAPFMVMEYVPGTDLAGWARQRGGPPLPLEEGVRVVSQICAGVAAIHAAGAVHGDVKPANVLVDPGDRPVLGDLGLARFLAQTHEGERSAVAGTPEYMAPEILSMKAPAPDLAPRIDVYSLGVIAFEMLTGRLPFFSTSIVELLNLHATVSPPPPSSVLSALPKTLDDVLLGALEKDPAFRTPTVQVLQADLERAVASERRSFRGVRILVADDDEDYLRLARILLAEGIPGAEIACFQSATDALASLDRAPAALALVDLHFPEMNGLELVASLRAHRTSETRVIVVTGTGGARDWRVLSSMGVEAFLTKPIQGPELVSTVKRVLGGSVRSEV